MILVFWARLPVTLGLVCDLWLRPQIITRLFEGRISEGKLMKKVILAILFVGVFVSTTATAETYICEITRVEKGAWIPRSLAISRDEKTGRVLVNDDLIIRFKSKPIEGALSVENDKRITFTWILPSIKNAGGQSTLRFNFRASYLKRTGKVVVTSQPAGYSNNFTGRGQCKVEG